MATQPKDPGSGALKLEISTANRRTTVACHGRLTSETSPHLRDKVKPLLERSSSLVLDLADVPYMDSSGLGTVMEIYTSAQKEQCDFRLMNLSKRIVDLLTITNLKSVLKMEGNLV
jgi:anti-sigma B factor antagonist